MVTLTTSISTISTTREAAISTISTTIEVEEEIQSEFNQVRYKSNHIRTHCFWKILNHSVEFGMAILTSL